MALERKAQYTQPISEVRSCRPRAASVPAVRAPGQIETACRVSNAGSPSHNVQGVQSILTAKRMLSLWEETRAIFTSSLVLRQRGVEVEGLRRQTG